MTSPFRELTIADVARINAKNKPRMIKVLPPDFSPLPSLRGPRSPKGKRGGFTAEQDKTRRQERQLAKRKGGQADKIFVSEALVLRACMDVLEASPIVKIWWRQNTGAGKLASGRYVKFSFAGASDLMGVLRNGLFLAVECKATGKKASPEQHAFLDNVIGAGGKGFVVDDAKDLLNALNWLKPAIEEGKP